ncbi:hypothetical protein LA56_333 [Francisella philomiragia]|uniref:hypothetical protein n=1 Tax=Francisella philomiragia TaxID=28110 RepID=UPI0005A56841|nr:hypothetical protein [Francisella philomiragia]AJI54933.1 hypothetical protein LA56_333 [Francisella philomiragia]MBK2252465.1 hypothetical protein [Francisella philomiragia]MBK2295674.1 hypothetical protein [Francisella philomiragia]MBK2340443.1 hypothetical protein [Francisella philomiragia]
MKLNKILIAVSVLFIPIQFCYSFALTTGGQIKDIAQNYAEKKYDRQYKVERTYDRGLSVVLGEYVDTGWLSSKKVNECTVFVANQLDNNLINANPTVPSIDGKYNVNSDNCGESILMPKIEKYIDSNFIANYYDLNTVNFRIKISYNSSEDHRDYERLSYNSERSYEIFNQDNNWNLSAKEWFDKYKGQIKIENVVIDIYDQPENPKSIIKAIEFSYNLDSYLRYLTNSNNIEGMYIHVTSLSSQEMKDKGGSKTKVEISKEHPRGVIYNYYLGIANAKNEPLTISNIYEHAYLTDSNSDIGYILVKDSKYYQPIQKILAKTINN